MFMDVYYVDYETREPPLIPREELENFTLACLVSELPLICMI